jgi:hypothetical protein
MSDDGARYPLACAMGALAEEERRAHRTLIEQLFGRTGLEREKLTNGYGFRFQADSFPDVVAFAMNERKCCPFLRFELDLSPSQGHLFLRMTGPEGTSAFLEAELGL